MQDFETNNDKEVGEKEDWEADQNLLGFFNLLLEVDRRVNPHLYKNPKRVESLIKKS